MLRPAPDETIVAISSGCRAAPIGIVRISGPDALRLVTMLERDAPGVTPDARRGARDASVVVDGLCFPARILTFRAPSSFTGQDLIELHVPGGLPLLRRLTDRLVELGARQALPGEFSARAYLNGKLSSAQADGVFGLIHAADGVAARQAARLARSTRGRELEELREELLDLLARLEAGIDFVDEEDVHFITAAEMRTRIERILGELSPGDGFNRRQRPHVVLAGLPNAGKSSLFNALVGRQRTIVSPIAGTTRDVIAAEIEVAGCAIVLQDTAGIAASVDDLDCAANRAADVAAGSADVVIWVHDAGRSWTDRERQLLAAIPIERVIHVASKIDLAPAAEQPDFAVALQTSTRTGRGLDQLRCLLASCVRALPAAPVDSRLAQVSAGLTRARQLILATDRDFAFPELVALEIRTVLDSLRQIADPAIDEAVLGVIFSKFCIGK